MKSHLLNCSSLKACENEIFFDSISSDNWRSKFEHLDLILPNTDMCIQTHDLLLTSADVLTSGPPSLYKYEYSNSIVVVEFFFVSMSTTNVLEYQFK